MTPGVPTLSITPPSEPEYGCLREAASTRQKRRKFRTRRKVESRLLQALRIARVDHQVRAGRRQRARQYQAKPFARARDQGEAARQVEHGERWGDCWKCHRHSVAEPQPTPQYPRSCSPWPTALTVCCCSASASRSFTRG